MTGAIMQLVHAAATVAAIAAIPGRPGEYAAVAFSIGAALFAAGVYVSGLAHVSLGPVAPTGGVTLMLGWLLLGAGALRGSPQA